jgi:hypothetical protein
VPSAGFTSVHLQKKHEYARFSAISYTQCNDTDLEHECDSASVETKVANATLLRAAQYSDRSARKKNITSSW